MPSPTRPDFAALYGRAPAATGRAHGRVNLIGDHTDYNDGFVLPIAIPQETVVEVAERPAGFAAYSATLDRRIEFDLDTAPADFAVYIAGCVKALRDTGVVVPPLGFRIASTVPLGSGLSSSAALEIATLAALRDLLRLGLTPVTLARLGQRAEVEYVGVPVGIMDQMACALATTDRMLFLDTRSLDYRLLPLPPGAEVVVIDSGQQRALSNSAYAARREECRSAAVLLGVRALRDVDDPAAVERLPSPFRERARHVVSENRRVMAARDADAATFGALMNASHESLRADYAVSTPALDALAAFLRAAPGAFGARMTGAGFGGACVALVRTGRGVSIAAHAKRSNRKWRAVVPETKPAH